MANRNGRKNSKRDDVNFSLMLQTRSLSQLSKLDGSDFEENFDPKLARSVVERDGISIELSVTSMLPFKASTHKALDYTLTLFTRNNEYRTANPDCMVAFSLDDYLEATGYEVSKGTRDYIRRKLRTDLDVIYRLSVDCESTDDDSVLSRERIISAFKIVNSEAMVQINPTLAKTLVSSYFIDLPKKLFAIPEAKQASYYIGKKLAEHATFNLNKNRGTNDIISVKSVLNACPVIPAAEEVPNSKYKERIQVPFINAMNYLAEKEIISYEFCNAKKIPLTEKQKERFNYSVFKNCYIHFQMLSEAYGD